MDGATPMVTIDRAGRIMVVISGDTGPACTHPTRGSEGPKAEHGT